MSLPIAGLPALPDVGSSETELRRPTCYLVQVITEPQRHGGVFLSIFAPASRHGTADNLNLIVYFRYKNPAKKFFSRDFSFWLCVNSWGRAKIKKTEAGRE